MIADVTITSGHNVFVFACDTRWANQGLEFLLVACEPRELASLTGQEFAVRSSRNFSDSSLSFL